MRRKLLQEEGIAICLSFSSFMIMMLKKDQLQKNVNMK
jgi:hypothetical protein